MNIAAQSKIKTNPIVEQVATGYQFLEGPLWVNHLGLLFSDIDGNTVYLRSSTTNQITPYFTPSGGGNGLALDLEGNLLVAQQNKRMLCRVVNGIETTLASTFESKRLNSPNDIAVKSDGSIFFTDPPYGIKPHQEELGFYGIYRISPNGMLELLDKSLQKPNGIAFSPDESKLYVSDSEERKVYSWDVLHDSTITNKQEIAFMKPKGNADGMVIDENGYIYCTGPLGIWIITPGGDIIETIHIPGQTTNCTFGDEDGVSLYVTAGASLYKVRNSEITNSDGSVVKEYNPFGTSYPSPSNDYTILPIHIKQKEHVKLEIKDQEDALVTKLVDEVLNVGSHNYTWNTKSISDGVYFAYLTVSGKVYIKAFIINR